jgi:hypothetical protein
MARRILNIADAFLPSLLGSGVRRYEVTRDALPADCRIINAKVDFGGGPGHQTLVLLLESAEWDESPEGGRIPEIMPLITDLRAHPVDF